uniref:Enoyl-CoA hydratase domain-containing protein 3, mitochondrial n=1 Tax=Amblyomma maculatum TaxID=34609 RepID=G3MPK4_AMBMU
MGWMVSHVSLRAVLSCCSPLPDCQSKFGWFGLVSCPSSRPLDSAKVVRSLLKNMLPFSCPITKTSHEALRLCLGLLSRKRHITRTSLTKQLHSTALLWSADIVSVHDAGGVRTVTLNNPKKRNVLSLDMLRELDVHFKEADAEHSVRCVVLCSSGPVFSSGHDLKELKIDSGGTAKIQEIFSLCTRVMTSIRRLSVPVIAQVNGLAAAAGCQLVATCDIVIATERSSFSLPGAAFGLFCSTPGIAVARCVPQKASAYMLMTGNAINAQEALISGLVSKVVPEEKLQEETDRVTSAIVAKSRSVLALGKKFYYRQIQMGIEDAYTEGEQVMLHNLQYCDSQEGINAFVEKRKPHWGHTDQKI